MEQPIRAVHYLNQFFAGLGGEAAANSPVEIREGAVGPGRLLEQELAGEGRVVATIVCGDSYFHDRREVALTAIDKALIDLAPDVVVAGPAFEAGRYGLACGEVGKMAMTRGIPAVTGMHPENPGVLMFRQELYIVPTGASAGEMPAAMARIARLAGRLLRREPLGPAAVEGYLGRGIRRLGLRGEPGSLRGVTMLLAKLQGRPYASEVSYQAPDRVTPAPPIPTLSRAVVALVTTGGLIPKGNPDNQAAGNARRYFRYSIERLERLTPDGWEAYHAGYFTHLVNRNPNYVLPLGYMRELEQEGVIGGVHPYAYTLPGVSTPVASARELGRGIARDLRLAQVDGCLMVST